MDASFFNLDAAHVCGIEKWKDATMRMYSTGETAKLLGVTRDSLHAALRTTAPDAANRIGNRRVFTEEEVGRLAVWFDQRRKIRDGLLRPWEVDNTTAQ